MTYLKRFIAQLCLLCALLLLLASPACSAEKIRIVAFYTEQGEQDHIDFAKQAIRFFSAEAKTDHFDFSSTTDWNELTESKLQNVQLVLWLNDEPHTPGQRAAFEAYMEHGGGWIGFHASAYNDRDTHWPWFVSFLGGAVFYNNNWPPLPARLVVEDRTSPITAGLAPNYTAPANEWYGWKPNPRSNSNIHVLLSLDPSNYPLGLKDVLLSGDIPVVWTNTQYRMLYINMGHGDHIFDDPIQNRLFRQALLSLGRGTLKNRLSQSVASAPSANHHSANP